MIILIVLLLGLGIGFFVHYRTEKSNRSPLTIPLCTMCTVIILVIFFMLSNVYFPKKPILVNTENIVSLKDSSNVQGDYFLMSGNFEEEMHYVYMTENNGDHSIEQIPVDHAVIRYTDKNYKIENYSERFKYDWMSFWFIYVPEKRAKTAIFYIPKGSIEQKYKIDLE